MIVRVSTTILLLTLLSSTNAVAEDLYVVYTDGRDTFGPRTAALMNRGVAIRATRLLRF